MLHQKSGPQTKDLWLDMTGDWCLYTPHSLRRPHSAAATAAAQSSSRYSTAADALAALVDAAASAPQMDVAKVKESKHEREDDMSARRAASLSEQQQQEAERRSMQSPYSGMSMPGSKPHSTYSEGPGVKDKGPQTSKSRIEEELRTRGKTTITAANFIDVIITRQIASDKDSRERGSQSSDSSSSCECIEKSLILFELDVST